MVMQGLAPPLLETLTKTFSVKVHPTKNNAMLLFAFKTAAALSSLFPESDGTFILEIKYSSEVGLYCSSQAVQRFKLFIYLVFFPVKNTLGHGQIAGRY